MARILRPLRSRVAHWVEPGVELGLADHCGLSKWEGGEGERQEDGVECRVRGARESAQCGGCHAQGAVAEGAEGGDAPKYTEGGDGARSEGVLGPFPSCPRGKQHRHRTVLREDGGPCDACNPEVEVRDHKPVAHAVHYAHGDDGSEGRERILKGHQPALRHREQNHRGLGEDADAEVVQCSLHHIRVGGHRQQQRLGKQLRDGHQKKPNAPRQQQRLLHQGAYLLLALGRGSGDALEGGHPQEAEHVRNYPDNGPSRTERRELPRSTSLSHEDSIHSRH
eukprot:1195970-Prorocentrum_minimum.AAC.2